MNESGEQPYAVAIALHIFYSLKAAPKTIFETIVGIITAAMSEGDVFLIVSGLVLLSFVLPWQIVFGGGLVLYATLRTVNAWLNNNAGARREEQQMIAQVLNAEKRVAIVQVPEVLTRSVEVEPTTEPGGWPEGDTGDPDGN